MNNKFSAPLAIILAVMVLAVVIPLNLLVGRLDIKWDMTPKNLTKLTAKSVNILKNLDKDVYLYTLFDLEEFKEDEANAHQLMPLYNLYKEYDKYDRITVISADPTQDAGVAILSTLNIPEELYWKKGDTLVVCEGMIKRIVGLNQFTEDIENARIYLNSENDLTSAVAYVSTAVQPVVYYLTGNGEASIDNYSLLTANMLKSGFTMKELDLETVDSVPEDTEVLISVAPTEDFSDGEYKKIIDFAEKGGNIELFLPPNDSEDEFKNIAGVLDTFGVQMNYDTISDPVYYAASDINSPMAAIVPYTGPSDDGTYEGDVANLTGDIISLATSEGISTYMPPSRSFYAGTTSDTTFRFGELLTAYSPDGTTYTSVQTPTGGPYKDTEVKSGSAYTLAVYSVNENLNDSALVVYGADFISNEKVETALYINPMNLFLVTITWMNESDISLNIPQKIITYDSMTFKTETDANKIIQMMSIIPIVIAAIGGIVWYRRGRS